MVGLDSDPDAAAVSGATVAGGEVVLVDTPPVVVVDGAVVVGDGDVAVGTGVALVVDADDPTRTTPLMRGFSVQW